MTIDLTAEPGEIGWHVVDQELSAHRCSRKKCPEPAVIFYLSRTYGYRLRAHWTRRWLCAGHMNQYQEATPWEIIDGRIVRPLYEFEKGAT